MDYKIQLKSIDKSTRIKNLPESVIGFILANLLKGKKNKNLLHVTNKSENLEKLEKEINFYFPEANVLLFPEWDTLPYDISSPSKNLQSERMKTLYNLINNKKEFTIVITTVNSLIQKVISKTSFNKISIKLNKNDKINIEELKKSLIDCSFRDVNVAISPGEFSINNNTLDIITSVEDSYRIKFSDKIEKIKKFNSITQLTTGNELDSIDIIPSSEVILNKENMLTFKSNYRKLFTKFKNEIYENVSNSIMPIGIENLLPLFYSNPLDNILNYLDETFFITLGISDEDLNFTFDLIDKYYKERKSISETIDKDLLYSNKEKLIDLINNFKVIKLNNNILKEKDERVMDLNIEKTEVFYLNNSNVFEDIKKLFE